MDHIQISPLEYRQIRQLKFASVAEACTLLVLIGVAVPLKHLGGWDTGVRVVGPLHGLAFLIYLWTVLRVAGEADWRRLDVLRLIVAAFVPFGGFTNLALLSRKASPCSDGVSVN